MAAHVWAAPLLLLVIHVSCASVVKTSNDYTEDIHRVLSALEKLVNFYQQSQNMNLDGFFGLRVLEGQLQLLIEDRMKGLHGHISADVFDKIISVKGKTQAGANIILESVKKDDPTYFNKFSYVVENPWRIRKPHRKLEPSLRWEIPQYKVKSDIKLDEETSDRCMGEVLNSASGGCHISESCAKIMTSRGLRGYGITHQLLWSAIGEHKLNCSTQLDKILSDHGLGNISMFQLELCTNNFYEMVAITQVLMHGKVHESHQDLFMEQQFVCPNLGFHEFLKKDYLDQILSWQFPSGCFGEIETSENEEEDVDYANLLQSYHNRGERPPQTKYVGNPNNLVENMRVQQMEQEGNEVKSPVESSNIGNMQQIPPVQIGKNNGKDATVLRVPKRFIVSKSKKTKRSVPPSSSHVLISESNQTVSKVKTNSSGTLHVETESYKPANLKFHQLDSNELNIGAGGVIDDQAGHKSDHIDERTVIKDAHINKGRRLLFEKVLEDGCYSHKTGVAAGALIMYLRFLIDPGDTKWGGQHELFLADTRDLLNAKVLDPEEEEDEEGVDEEEMEDDEGIIGDNENVDGVDEEEDDDYNQDDEDYDDEENNNEEEQDGPVIQFGPSHKSDTIVINEDGERDALDYANVDGKLMLNQNGKQMRQSDIEVDGDVGDQEEDPNYYDDEGETDRGIIKRRKPPTPRPHPPIKTRRKHSGNTVSHENFYGTGRGVAVPDHPNYLLFLLVSLTPFLLIFYLFFKFVRKRRVHIRYYF